MIVFNAINSADPGQISHINGKTVRHTASQTPKVLNSVIYKYMLIKNTGSSHYLSILEPSFGFQKAFVSLLFLNSNLLMENYKCKD